MYGFGTDAFYSDLDPERGYNIETGLEVAIVPWLNWVVSGYLLDMTDEIAVVETAPFVYETVNQDKTRHLGMETELALHLLSLLDLTAGYTYTRATFRAGANSGNRIPLIPEHSLNTAATFELPLDFDLGASARYVSDMYPGGDNDNDREKIQDYWLIDLFVRYNPEYLPGDLELYVGVDNVMDKSYSSTGFEDFFSNIYYYPGTGRFWKVGGSYRY